MTTKEIVLQTVQALPDNASIEEAMEKLLFLAKVEHGIQEANEAKTIPHHVVKERMRGWLE